jgi:hypothetical protein
MAGAARLALAPAVLLALALAPSAIPAGTAANPTKPVPAVPKAPPPSQADAASAAIVQQLTDAMGGQSAWDNLSYLRFDFVVVRDGKEVARFKHWWDKKHGRCRVEGPDEQGRVVTAIFNLSDLKGTSFTEGIVDTDPSNTAAIIRNGYERWVNDTYWLAMPFKLRDPGTRLFYSRAGRTEAGVPCDVIELTFAPGVGLTPEDHYWIYVNRETHLVDQWEYVLQGEKPPPQPSTWQSWRQVGPLKLSEVRRFAGRPVMIRFENLAAPATMDETIFTHARPKEP